MNRVKRLAYSILDIHGDSFSSDFKSNKEILDKVARIRSKQLRNEIAGFITKILSETLDKKQEKPAATIAEVG